MKKILFSIICFLYLSSNALALSYQGCDYSTISRLKSLVNNINISYDYHMNNGVVYFDVTLVNIPEGVYFIDTISNKTYTYQDTNNGEITIYNYLGNPGKYNFYSSSSDCSETKIGIKYYKFPSYNIYYGSDLCKDVQNYSLCQKWVKVNYSYSELEDLIYEYKEKKNKVIEEESEVVYQKSFIDEIVEIYARYYYAFLGFIIVICLLTIMIKNKQDKFKL